MTLRKTTQRAVARGAFTLMEILIVVVIIVMLAGIATFYILPQFAGAKVDTARVHAFNVEKALTAYYKDHGTWPTDINQLCLRDEMSYGPYISEEGLYDPWGQLYQIDVTGPNNQGAKPDVFTTTPEGEVVGNWRTK